MSERGLLVNTVFQTAFRIYILTLVTNPQNYKDIIIWNLFKSVLESTSGSYLERMDSFLAKHDNDEIAQILSNNTDENYEVDIDWSKIPHKETADVGENTVGYLRK